MPSFQTVSHEADFCVVGGGLAGLFAAVSAARRGTRVILMQDRPMLGGNASSEIRMWVSGAWGENNRETGLLEEAALENQYRNPDKNYSIWDSILYGMAREEKNITLLLNCSCLDAETENGRILSVTGWQTTTQRYHRVSARLFADCSGDSVLAPLTGAEFRIGRESRHEFGETVSPENADRKTMGMTCLIQARETDHEVPFIAPPWAEKITREKLGPMRHPDLSRITENFWYLELGGDRDSIGDTEELRDELVALAYGMWDYLKNDPEQKEKNKNWDLEWIGMLPGKRESRRYVGPHIMSEKDVDNAGAFEDTVAYGGWTMDDHHPSGFRTFKAATIFHPAPSPFGIPYRCLYSVNISNLFFAGRNISVTHAAFSAIRVMATCALCGQAAGTAAALALAAACDPAAVSVPELQAALMEDDCFLPGFRRAIAPLTLQARMTAGGENAAALLDGTDRDRPGENHHWTGKRGDSIRLDFSAPSRIESLRLVFDSDLDRKTLPKFEQELPRSMLANRHLLREPSYPPKTLIRAFTLEGIFEDGRRELLIRESNNYQRLRRYPLQQKGLTALIFTPLQTWGSEDFRLFSIEAR